MCVTACDMYVSSENWFSTQFEKKSMKKVSKIRHGTVAVDDACVLDCFSGSMIRANNTRKMEHSC